MKEFRLIIDHFPKDAFTNMAIDEAICKLHDKNREANSEILFLKPSAISLGYFQSLKEEVDEQKCSELGVDIVRRITGAVLFSMMLN